jgi:hypothetical protein
MPNSLDWLGDFERWRRITLLGRQRCLSAFITEVSEG